MKINKRGQVFGNILMIMFMIMMFGVFSVIMITGGYMSYAVGNDYIVLPLYNASTTFDTSAEITEGFENTVIYYQGIDLGFMDNLWLFAYSTLVVMSFGAAYMVRSTNYFSFFSILTYGLMVILFVAGLFGTLIQFLYNDILLKLFINIAIDTPFLAYYVLNYGFIFLIHSVLLLLVTNLDMGFAGLQGRKNKEIASLDDELI